MHAAVIGGGLAGLTAARRLAAAGAEVTLFESEDDLGGRVRTRRRDGYVLDRGFQVLFTAYPAVRWELDLEALDLRRFAPGATIVRPGTRSVVSDPRRRPRDALATLANGEVPPADLLRLFRLQRALRRRDPGSIFPGPDRSIADRLEEAGFSRSFVEAFAAPFYGGITLDRSLSSAAAVFEYTFKMLSEGAIALPAAGMGAIPRQLAERARGAGARIETGVAVTAVEPTEDGRVRIEHGGSTTHADAAVVATDPRSAADLTGVDAIPTAGRGCVTQYCALDERAPLSDERRLLLNAEPAGPNQVAVLSAVAPSYAPPGRTLLSATYLGDPDGDDEALADRTREAVGSWYPELDAGRLEPVHTDRIPFAQFDQPPGRHASLPASDAPAGPVYLAGDYTRWSSIQGALESGRVAARAASEAGGARS